MNIRFVNDKKNIELINKKGLWISLEPDWQKGDIILYDRDLVLFEQDPISDALHARRSLVLNGTSLCAVEIFKKQFQTYRECEDIDASMDRIEDGSMEKFFNSITTIVDRVKKHNKISDKEEEILLLLLKGEKSKKSLVREGLCTYGEITEAYSGFMSEMQWCYGFKNPVNIYRAKQFNSGELCFCHSVRDFADALSVDVDTLKKILFTVIDSQIPLEKSERDFVASAVTKDNFENEFSVEQRERLGAIVHKAVEYFYEYEKEFYRNEADELIKKEIVYIRDIYEYCTISAFDYSKMLYAIRKAGVNPVHRRRR